MQSKNTYLLNSKHCPGLPEVWCNLQPRVWQVPTTDQPGTKRSHAIKHAVHAGASSTAKGHTLLYIQQDSLTYLRLISHKKHLQYVLHQYSRMTFNSHKIYIYVYLLTYIYIQHIISHYNIFQRVFLNLCWFMISCKSPRIF